MFKIGERVVYIGGCKQPMMSTPEIGEVVVVASVCSVLPSHYDICGYLRAKNGVLQSFHSDHLRKLDTDWAEKVLAEVLESELVLIEG